MKLDELKVIITGGAQGIGLCFATELAAAGAQVAVGDVNEGALASLPAGIHRRRLDVTDTEDIARFVTWARETMGGLNALVNNAGIIRDGLLVKKDRVTGEVKRLSDADWHAVIGVNLTGATFVVREFVTQLVEHDIRPAVIVNMSSIARHGNRGQSNYVSAKAALASNSVTWAREFAAFGIRVAAIAPGVVETPMTQGMKQRARDAMVAQIPVGRIGRPDDIWRALQFILECDYVNGTVIEVHGGFGMG